MEKILIGEKIEEQTPFIVKVNGQTYETYKDKTLLRFLRDDLHIKSVKDGCSQGACGTCTVLVGEENKRSCVVKLSKLKDTEVLTNEGLSQEEKDAFTYAFTKAGAVQCGFCIPGMVMSGASVIKKNPNPTEEEIKLAIKGNICRCTGYVKIIKGIQMAAAILRGELAIEEEKEQDAKISLRTNRIDAKEKILGTGIYADDIEIEGMLYGSCVRTKYPRAKFIDIDYSEALKLEGVVGVLTAEDVPNNKVGHIQQDWDVFIEKGSETRSLGDALCFVVAESPEIVEEAKKLIKVDLEELKPVSSIAEAKAKDAPKIHPNGNLCQERHVSRGNAEEALKECAYVVTHDYKTPFTEHAFLEPECCVAMPYKDGIKVYSSDQSVYDTRKELSIMFGWQDKPERIVVENPYVGGGFGGKEDMSVQPPAALAAYLYQRPVKHKMTRDESLRWHPKRHPMEGRFTLGCDENGIFKAMKVEINFDTGAYASLCGPVLERACTHSVGPYNYQNTEIHGYGYYTNNPPAGAFRGFGVCQSNFAMESNINLLAQKVGISPWEIRYRNAIKPGQVLPNGQIADCSTALVETLEKVKDVYEKNKDHAGIACAMKNAGVGVGLPDKGRAKIKIEDGICKLYCAASGIGQGVGTVMLQIIGEATGLLYDKIKIMTPNSETSPDSGTTSGSRHTLITGEAVRRAAEELAKDLKNHSLEELEGKEYFYEYFDPTDPLGSDKEFPKSHLAYGFATHVVILDDEGKVKEVYAAHDSGKVINPTTIEGQIEGGVIMGLGYALTEDLKVVNSVVKAKYGTLGLWRAPEIPKIHPILVEKEKLLDIAYGAKGIGEIATIPIAAAVQGAYYALDGVLRDEFPMKETAYSKPKKEFKKQ
ncbi:MAG: selenium-dependent xanthine dehydrogenase [Peptoniphilaceae bacterium]|nr:selenium-dependent xanthine dehydrogenase [Peptoniphilaceae bacterium]MDY6018729.1 selenium-dependent xanthine dehydrogenase [Anaerococcus sp.]